VVNHLWQVSVFEKVVVRGAVNGQGLSLGELAEALLLYQNVHVLLDQQSLHSLGQTLGIEELIALLRRRRFTATYAENILAASNETGPGGFQHHSFVTPKITGRMQEVGKPGVTLKSRRERLAYTLERIGKSPGDARKLADKLFERVKVVEFSGDTFIKGGVHKAATETLADEHYVTAALRCVLRDQVGFQEYAERFQPEIIKLDASKFILNTNISFAEGNDRRKKIDPTLEGLTLGNLAVALFDAASDLSIAAHYGGDFYTSAINSDILRIRREELLRRTDLSQHQHQQFQEIALDGYPTLREVIDKGERSFAEFEKLLDDARKVREMVHAAGPDANLVREYTAAVSKEGWISGLPAKGARYVIGLALGSHPAIGAVFAAFDTFLLDKFKGWRPNHFVDKRLKPFLEN
jgi:hypothetical protein